MLFLLKCWVYFSNNYTVAIFTPPIVKLVLTAAEAAITVLRVYFIHVTGFDGCWLVQAIFDVWKSFWTERSAFMTVEKRQIDVENKGMDS